MPRYSDAALLTGKFSSKRTQLQAGAENGRRRHPADRDWREVSNDNDAEIAAQEIARQIFAFEKSLAENSEKNPEQSKQRIEILTFAPAGQMRVLALVPCDGDMMRIDGTLLPDNQPASAMIHVSQLSLSFVPVAAENSDDEIDDGLAIGFVIFNELKERQKARYKKPGKKMIKPKRAQKAGRKKAMQK